MRERLIELLAEIYPKTRYIPMQECREKTVDYLLKNGVVALPCNVGDLVYVIRSKEKRNQGGYYNSICDTKRIMNEAIKNGTAYIDCKRATKSDFTKIGTTIFLTKEEAEQALERSEK